MIKVAIANDTLLALEALRRVIATDPAYQLVWTAREGTQAIELAERHRPDLILMDLQMPGIGGAEATRQIMARSPCAILIVTGSVERNTSLVFEAMGYGALDVVQTPVLGAGQTMATAAQPLLAKMAVVIKAFHLPTRPVEPCASPKNLPVNLPDLVVIGASTGGPKAIAKILNQLPASFTAAIVVVQHIDPQFTARLADWLNAQSALPVALAQRGDRPLPGKVLLAKADGHLVMRSDRTLAYTQEVSAAHNIYRPSVDVFFESVARHWPPTEQKAGRAVLLTGMGRDGAAGLGALREAGWQTIAESQESCVVYGMPHAAVTRGAAVSVMAAGDIASRLM